ncbi:MAG: hypothetical protein SPI63_06420 [Bulleidia sp.]|nr:hypothetical protein [Bulleidia sp.]
MTRRVLSAAGYIVKNMITYIVYLIVRRKTFQHDYLFVIPLASNVLLCLISIYYPVIFRFN